MKDFCVLPSESFQASSVCSFVVLFVVEDEDGLCLGHSKT
jgi:hypothetical protein